MLNAGTTKLYLLSPAGIVIPHPAHLYVGQPLGQHAVCNFSMVSISLSAWPSPLPCHCQNFLSINFPSHWTATIHHLHAGSFLSQRSCLWVQGCPLDGSLWQRIDVRLEEWKWGRNISSCRARERERLYSCAIREGRGEVMGEALLASGCDCSPLKGGSHEVMGLRRRKGCGYQFFSEQISSQPISDLLPTFLMCNLFQISVLP